MCETLKHVAKKKEKNSPCNFFRVDGILPAPLAPCVVSWRDKQSDECSEARHTKQIGSSLLSFLISFLVLFLGILSSLPFLS
jgi:hypothetical protein